MINTYHPEGSHQDLGNSAPKGRDGDRLFLANDSLVDRSNFIKFLNRCATDWDHCADGSFYGLKYRVTDAAASAMAVSLRQKAKAIYEEGIALGFLKKESSTTSNRGDSCKNTPN